MLVDTGAMVDVVVVHHNERNRAQFVELVTQLAHHHQMLPIRVIDIDNSTINRGFARGCNVGAYQGEAPVIAFLNPDLTVNGPFIGQALQALQGDVIIVGERFGKPDSHLREWGCDDWVCGACLFVRRDWFDHTGGFDDNFMFGWEETDLIRRAQAQGLKVKSIPLPVDHTDVAAHDEPDPVDRAFKTQWFEHGKTLFRERWQDGEQR